MFEKIELNEEQSAIWNTITEDHKFAIIDLAKNYDEAVGEDDWTFPESININDIDAATYTSLFQYRVWREITTEQKQLVLWVWNIFVERYNDLLIRKYNEQELNLTYNIFCLHVMFINQEELRVKNNFKFLTNQKK